MNKTFFLSGILLFLFVLHPIVSQEQISSIRQVDTNTILCSFSLPHFTIADTTLPRDYGVRTTFKYIKMSDPSKGYLDSVGFPDLPFLSYNFEIPYHASNCEIELYNIQYDSIYINGQILPRQIDTLWEDMVTGIPFRINTLCYSSDSYFLSEEFRLSEPFIIRGVKGVRAILMPFSYNPSRNLLKVIVSANIRIHYNTHRGQDTAERVVPKTWDNLLNKIFVNYNHSRIDSGNENYLIITLPDYTESLLSFADYKQVWGYNVNIVTLEDDQRTPEAIKEIIQEQYNEPSTRPDYVLLVGNHPSLPAYSGDERCEDQDIGDPITDVPYVFLEGNDDKRDAFIGRWPVGSTSDVTTMANKTIFMEMNMRKYEKKAVLIAGYHSGSIMENAFESGLNHIRNGSFSSLGYNCSQLNQPDTNTALWNLNSDPLFYIYSGHGNCYSWGPIDSTQWTIEAEFITQSIHNTFPMIFSFACKTGNYAINNNTAINWMRKESGGATYFGSSVNTYPDTDNQIEEKTFCSDFEEAKTIGSMITFGMNQFYDSFLPMFWRVRRYMKAYNLMGDPAFLVSGRECTETLNIEQLRLHSGDVHYYPASESVSFSNNVTAHNGSELITHAGREIVFKDGFHASAGAEVTATIKECVEQRGSEPILNNSSNDEENKSFITSENQDNRFNVEIYPNPTQGEITVEIPNAVKGNVHIQIMDMYGRQLLSRSENVDAVSYRRQLDIRTLPSGCYYAVVTANGNRIVKCIVKQ